MPARKYNKRLRFQPDANSTGYIVDSQGKFRPIACNRYERDALLDLLNSAHAATCHASKAEPEVTESMEMGGHDDDKS